MRRNSGSSFRNSGAYTSPGTPDYSDSNVGDIPKTWSSERVPLPSNSSSRRHVSAAALMPFNSGRALPSKWDDAERWITSPISGFKNSIVQPQRRPKSKSGPLGPAGLGYLPNYSPNMIGREGGNVRNYMVNSPLTTGVFVPDGLSVVRYEGGVSAKLSDSSGAENSMTRSTSVPGLSDLLSETSLPSSQDGKLDIGKEEEARVSRRDMATQMSPEEGSNHSSTRARLSFSILPSSSIPSSSARIHRNPVAKDDVRDVQVDKGTTTSRQSKKHGLKRTDSGNARDLSSSWNVTNGSKNISKLQREEAKIDAWENLQKAKAEAAIRKLEMKLEKKRSSSMDKITNKLRGAEMKAQAMRNSLPENRAPRNPRRRVSISCCIYFKICSVCRCFACKRK